MTREEKIDCLFLYTCQGIPVTSRSQGKAVITDYVAQNSNNIYSWLRQSVNTRHQGGNTNRQGENCGCFLRPPYSGRVTREMIAAYVDSGSRMSLIDYIDAMLGTGGSAGGFGAVSQNSGFGGFQNPSRKTSRPSVPRRSIPSFPTSGQGLGGSGGNFSISPALGKKLAIGLVVIGVLLMLFSKGGGITHFFRHINWVKIISLGVAVLAIKPLMFSKNSDLSWVGRMVILLAIWASVLYYITHY